MAYHRYQKVDTRIVRIFNTYGPRMRLDDGRVVPTLRRARPCAGEPLTVFGDGTQTRSFCYVDDLVEGMSAAPARSGPRPGEHRQPARDDHPRVRRRGAAARAARDVPDRAPAAAAGRPARPPAGHHPGAGGPRLGAAGSASTRGCGAASTGSATQVEGGAAWPEGSSSPEGAGFIGSTIADRFLGGGLGRGGHRRPLLRQAGERPRRARFYPLRRPERRGRRGGRAGAPRRPLPPRRPDRRAPVDGRPAVRRGREPGRAREPPRRRRPRPGGRARALRLQRRRRLRRDRPHPHAGGRAHRGRSRSTGPPRRRASSTSACGGPPTASPHRAPLRQRLRAAAGPARRGRAWWPSSRAPPRRGSPAP